MTQVNLRVPLLPLYFRWMLVVFLLGAILYYSVVKLPGPGRIVYGPFKIFPISMWFHAIAYIGLAISLAYAFTRSPRPDWQILLGIFVFVTAYGLGIELLQLGIPTRSFDPTDIIINAFGAALAVTSWKILTRYIVFYRLRCLGVASKLWETFQSVLSYDRVGNGTSGYRFGDTISSPITIIVISII